MHELWLLWYLTHLGLVTNIAVLLRKVITVSDNSLLIVRPLPELVLSYCQFDP